MSGSMSDGSSCIPSATSTSGDDLPWQIIAFALGATTVLFIITTCTLSVCLCAMTAVACRRRREQSPKDHHQPLVQQASFSVPLSTQVYGENDKGKPSDGPGSTNTFTAAGTTVHSSPLRRNSTASSTASGGYVEMKGGGLEDLIPPQMCPTVSQLSVPSTTNPSRHASQNLQYAPTVSSALSVNPLDYENATAWLLAEKIKEQNMFDCSDAPDLPPTRPKPAVTHRRSDLGNDRQSSSVSSSNYPERMSGTAHQPPKLPPKRYKEIEFMMMEPSSEYMKPNVAASSLPRTSEAELSLKTYSKSTTLTRM